MANGVMVVTNPVNGEMMTMPMDNVEIAAEDYALLATTGTMIGIVVVNFTKSDDRYNAIRAIPTYASGL